MNKYSKYFSEIDWLKKLRSEINNFGTQLSYTAVLLYLAYKRKETPSWARHIILGTLGYLIAPIDAIPDLSPLIGYTDDLGVLSFALVTISCYINQEVKEEAKHRLTKFVKQVDLASIEEIDKLL